MRRVRRNLLVVWLATGCSGVTPTGLSPSQLYAPPRVEWGAATALPAAAEACREAGYPADEIAETLVMLHERNLPPEVAAEALHATAVHARQYGPIGDLSTWLGDKLIRQGLRGVVLERAIQVQHATWGFQRLDVPAQGPTSSRPTEPAEGA